MVPKVTMVTRDILATMAKWRERISKFQAARRRCRRKIESQELKPDYQVARPEMMLGIWCMVYGVVCWWREMARLQVAAEVGVVVVVLLIAGVYQVNFRGPAAWNSHHATCPHPS